MFPVSMLWLQPAQLELLTLVVQYQHDSVTDVAHGDPGGHVLVLVLVGGLPEQLL